MATEVITQKDPEIKTDINAIQIPDLWHIAMKLTDASREKVLEVWHLCHSLRDHIQQNG